MKSPSEDQATRRRFLPWLLYPFAFAWWGIKRLLIVVVVISFVWGMWSALDPPEPLRISPETTLITEPIAEDGLPDFAGALLDRLGRGVKPEDNGAVEFWQAIGPGEVDPNLQPLLFAEIGCPIPDPDQAIKTLRTGQTHAEVSAWLSASQPDLDPIAVDIQCDELLRYARQRHGAVEAVPPLVGWIRNNGKQLDLLCDSASKPSFYSPPPTLLAAPPAPLSEIQLAAERAARDPMVGLATRAAWRIGRAEYPAAWKDIETVLVFGERCTSEPLLVPQLVGVAMRANAFEGIQLLADHCQDAAVLRQLIDRLSSLGDPDWGEESLRFGEPLVMVDSLVSAIEPSRPAGDLDLSEGQGRAFDPNLLLGEIRLWQDRLAEIASMPDRRARRLAAEEFVQSLENIRDNLSSWTLITNVLSRAVKSRTMGRIYVELITPAVVLTIATEDRSCAQQRLTLAAVALKLHRLQHGEYPDTLDAITPDPLAEIPLDPFTGEPFRYERRGEGFAIWSLGPNGVDDGGSDMSGEFIDGDYAPIDWTGERPKPDGPDDVVVRLPVPKLELPGAPTND